MSSQYTKQRPLNVQIVHNQSRFLRKVSYFYKKSRKMGLDIMQIHDIIVLLGYICGYTNAPYIDLTGKV